MADLNTINKSEILGSRAGSIIFLMPEDEDFEYEGIKKFFEENKKDLNVEYDFEYLLDNSHFFAVYVNCKLTSCVYFFHDEEFEKSWIFMNAFSKRKNHLANIKALKTALDFYSCDIYARSNHKTAIFCLLRAGFRKIGEQIYKYERD